MSDEHKQTGPSAEALRFMFGGLQLAEIGPTLRAQLALLASVAVTPPTIPLAFFEAARAVQHFAPSPAMLRAVAAAYEPAVRVGRELAELRARQRRTLEEAARTFAAMRASVAAWRDSEEGRAFFAAQAEAREREENDGAQVFNTIA